MVALTKYKGMPLIKAKLETTRLFKFLWLCYGYPTKLLYKDHLLESAFGCESSDSFGSIIFSLAMQLITRVINSEFDVGF